MYLKAYLDDTVSVQTFDAVQIGLVIGNIPWVRNSFDEQFLTTLNFVAEFGMICYMFVLGMEMDPYVILKPPTQPAIIAYSGLLSTIILACIITPFMQYALIPDLSFTLSLSITLSGSGSHILTRIITNLKIGKSDIGKLVIAAGVHSDMMTMLLICIGYIFVPPSGRAFDFSSARVTKAGTMASALLLQTIFAAKVSPMFLNWVNNENPEGKPMKGSHLVLSIAFMVMVCTASPIYGYSPILSAFMAGIFLPSEGRVSKWAVGKINYLLTTIFYPLFFFWMGYHANLQRFNPVRLATWEKFAVLIVIALFGKVIGTVICGVILGYHWRESAELGLLLSAKGHFHIFLAILLSTVSISASDHIHMPFVLCFHIIRPQDQNFLN